MTSLRKADNFTFSHKNNTESIVHFNIVIVELELQYTTSSLCILQTAVLDKKTLTDATLVLYINKNKNVNINKCR